MVHQARRPTRVFKQLKYFRAVAARYEKLARNCLAGVQLAAV